MGGVGIVRAYAERDVGAVDERGARESLELSPRFVRVERGRRAHLVEAMGDRRVDERDAAVGADAGDERAVEHGDVRAGQVLRKAHRGEGIGGGFGRDLALVELIGEAPAHPEALTHGLEERE